MTDSTPTRADWETLVAHNKALIDRNVALRDRAEAAEAANARWQRNSIETWQVMQTMRNDINEHLPMPSMESDLLQGPENSIFCASVYEAVITALTEARRAEAAAWNDAIEAAAGNCDATEASFIYMANANLPVISPIVARDRARQCAQLAESIRALRRAAPRRERHERIRRG